MQVIANESNRRVDVTIDGKPFTSYIYPTTLKKPVLYPIRTAKGTASRAGSRSSRAPASASIIRITSASGSITATSTVSTSGTTPTPIPADGAPKMGTILHRRVVEAKSGADRGELIVEMRLGDAGRQAAASRADALRVSRRADSAASSASRR